MCPLLIKYMSRFYKKNSNKPKKLSLMMERIKHKSQRRAGTTNSGDSYEIDLLILYKIIGERDTDGFYLDTNVEGVGAFDDIVFRFWNKEVSRIILLQAKHKENLASGKITIEKFKNPNDDKFYLGKYMSSFLKCKEKFNEQSEDPVFRGNFKDLDISFIIYTNCILDEYFDNNRIIDIGKTMFCTKSEEKAFKFCQNQNNKNYDLIKMLENVSCQERVKLLAKALVSYVSGKLNYNNMMSNKLFSTYHVFLSKNVIEVEEEISKDKKNVEYRGGKINCNFFNIDNKNLLETEFKEEVLCEYAKQTVFKEKSCLGLDDSNQDDLANEIADSLKSTKKLPENLIQKLGGSVIVFDVKKKELKFAEQGKLEDKRAKKLLRILENKVSNLSDYKFDIPYRLIIEILANESLKLHVNFGNINPSFKKAEHLINQLIKLFVQHKNCSVIEINETLVGHGNILTKGDLKNIGKLIGNLLVFDQNEKKLRLACEETLSENALKFIRKLKTQAQLNDLDIDDYRFDIKIKNFPRDILFVEDEDRSNAEEFLSKLEIYTGEASDSELREIIKDEMKTLFKLTDIEVEENFLKIRNKAEDFWRNGKYYLEKNDDFFPNVVRFNIEFDIREPADLFIGREVELRELDRSLKKNRGENKCFVISQMASISGLGGIGKSELARKYISEYRDAYDGNLIWINAETDQTLAQSFHDLAENKLKISRKNKDGTPKSIKSIVEEVYGFFAGRKGLFVFDNAEKSADLKFFLPRHGLLGKHYHLYILITSREHKEVWEQWGVKEGIQLDVLNENEAISFVKNALDNYLNISDGSQDEQIRQLAVGTLFKFPLALRQAVAHIREENKKKKRRGIGIYSINDYLKEYKEKKKELLSSEAFKSLDNDYTKTTFTTWKVTIDKIKDDKEDGKLALQILDVIAFFTPDNIPVEIFFSKLQKINNNDNDNGKLWNAVELLNQYSMIKLEQGKIYIHRLVQEVTMLNIGDREEQVLDHALKLFQIDGDEIDLFSDNLRLRYVDHALSVWGYANKHEKLVRKFSCLPVLMISELNATLRYQEAYLFGSNTLKLLEIILGGNLPSVLSMMKNTACVLYNQGRDKDSLQMFLKLKSKFHAIDKKLVLPNLVFTVDNFIGLILNRQGRYDEALEIFTHQYNLVKENVIISNGSVEHNLALTLFNKNKLEEATEMYRKALEVKTRVFGCDHESTLNTENSMSLLLEMRGEYDEALEKSREIYEKRKRILGTNHPYTLTSYGNIAMILNKLMKYDEALTIAIEVDKERDKLVPNHPRTLKGKFLIVSILASQGKYEESLVMCKRVYEKRKEILGLNHPDTIDTLDSWYSLALIFAEQRNHEKGLEEFKYILKERETALEPNHPEIFKTKVVINMLRRTLDDGDNIDFKMINAIFLLHAARDGQLEVVCELLTKGVDPNLETVEGNATPLFLAAQNGHARVVQQLVERGAEVNVKAENGSTSLHVASHRNDLDVVNTLLKGNADVNCYDNALFRPLHYAAQAGHTEIVKLLLKNGADIHATTISDWTALHIAASLKQLEVLKILLEEGAYIDPVSKIYIDETIEKILIATKELLDAVKKKQNRSKLKRLLEDGAVINYFSDSSRLTSFHYVVSQGNLDIVELFLKKNANVNFADVDGWTPLHYAAQNGDLEILKLLLDYRADPNITNRDGKKPVQLARERLNQNPRIYQEVIYTLE